MITKEPLKEYLFFDSSQGAGAPHLVSAAGESCILKYFEVLPRTTQALSWQGAALLVPREKHGLRSPTARNSIAIPPFSCGVEAVAEM